MITIDWKLLSFVSVGAFLGGIIGNYLLHFKVSPQMIKKLIAIVLYILAFQLIV
jgi:uncharacterized membrane protein YfcA